MKTKNPLLLFNSRNRSYACDLIWIREVLRRPSIRIVDGAPPIVRGLIHLRGQILTAIDLEARLGLPAEEPHPENRCLVFKTSAELLALPDPPPDATQASSDLVGILVDNTSDIVPPGTTILPPPPGELSGIDPICVRGVIPIKDNLVTVLETSALFNNQKQPTPQKPKLLALQS
ncbi:MAG: chemotaxis protein CheW [Chthoniobacterales bacterium]|nr:chemotaxis protein CheW [Chthoniobacterales bacterium]MCX7713483.1 chemotaxis protein CheW [Chthoniobacterales bacterium]